MLKKFKRNELFYNRIKTHPYIDFTIFDRNVYYNNKPKQAGQNVTQIQPAPSDINLYELNVDRMPSQRIYPFLTKDGTLSSFKTITSGDYNDNFTYGDTLTGSYLLTASIQSLHYAASATRTYVDALKNTLNYYTPLSNHYSFSSSLGNKSSQTLRLITIPSIFYGSSIKKGSVDLGFYITGSLKAQLQDIRQNGELVQVGPSGSVGSGSVAGVVLYNEGFMVLTGAWDISNGTHTEEYVPGAAVKAPTWIDFATTGSDSVASNVPKSSFKMSFQGTNYVPTVTMLCNAGRGELNFSNNPTFIKKTQVSGSKVALTSSNTYKEFDKLEAENIVKTPWSGPTGSYEPITYISKVGIFDENRNLIAIAKLVRPLRKRLEDSYSIKLKVDF